MVHKNFVTAMVLVNGTAGAIVIMVIGEMLVNGVIVGKMIYVLAMELVMMVIVLVIQVMETTIVDMKAAGRMVNVVEMVNASITNIANVPTVISGGFVNTTIVEI